MRKERKKDSRWTTIRIPVELRDQLKALSQKTGKVYWEIIVETLSFYETQLRKPRIKESLGNIEKSAWYITKLATSFGAFKENPNDENFTYLQKRVKELKDKLDIDASLLLRIAEYYRRTKDEELRRKIRIDLNMAFKQVVKDIMIKSLYMLIPESD